MHHKALRSQGRELKEGMWRRREEAEELPGRNGEGGGQRRELAVRPGRRRSHEEQARAPAGVPISAESSLACEVSDISRV